MLHSLFYLETVIKNFLKNLWEDTCRSMIISCKIFWKMFYLWQWEISQHCTWPLVIKAHIISPRNRVEKKLVLLYYWSNIHHTKHLTINVQRYWSWPIWWTIPFLCPRQIHNALKLMNQSFQYSKERRNEVSVNIPFLQFKMAIIDASSWNRIFKHENGLFFLDKSRTRK